MFWTHRGTNSTNSHQDEEKFPRESLDEEIRSNFESKLKRNKKIDAQNHVNRSAVNRNDDSQCKHFVYLFDFLENLIMTLLFVEISSSWL